MGSVLRRCMCPPGGCLGPGSVDCSLFHGIFAGTVACTPLHNDQSCCSVFILNSWPLGRAAC